MKSYPPLTSYVLSAALCVLMGASALAQEASIDRQEAQRSVLTRYTDEYDPVRLRTGKFLISPMLTTSVRYNDNVFATENDEEDDLLWVNTPQVRVDSDFARHALGLELSASSGEYADNTDENYLDYRARLSGRLDVTGQTSIPLSLEYRRDHFLRGSPDDVSGSEPTEFDRTIIETGFDHGGHTLEFSGRSRLEEIRFDDNIGAGGIINNQDLNRSDWDNTLRIGMAQEAQVAPFVYGRFEAIDYDASVNDEGVNRDATETEIGIGSTIDYSDVTRFSASIGWVQRDNDDARFDEVEDFTASLDMTWEPTATLALTLTGERLIEETTIGTLSASVDSRLALSGLYEIAPNLLLNPRLEYREKDYDGGSDATALDIYQGNLTLNYKMTRNIWALLAYDYRKQEEAVESPSFSGYTQNTVSFSVQFQL